MNWPKRVREGRVVDAAASSLDLLPTICELAGAVVPADRRLDGISLAPLLISGTMPERPKPLVWAYYNAINDARVAMRHGPWKILARLNGGQLPRYENLTAERLREVQNAPLTDYEIYNLQTDPGETLNLSGRGLAEEVQLTTLLESEYRALASDSIAWNPPVKSADVRP
jgi:arylsulfatase A